MRYRFAVGRRASGLRGPAAPCPRPCVAEPLEERVLMAVARATGGSGYSGTLSSNPAIRQQQLICDPPEPLRGSTSVTYNPQQVSLAGATPGPGYNNRFFGGFVEVSNFDGGAFLIPLNQFLANRPGPGFTGETGFVQIFYQLDGTAGQIQPPTSFTVRDEGGVDGIDTHALLFDLLPGVSTAATIPYTIRALNANTRSGNAEDFLVINDAAQTRLGPAQLASAVVTTNPTNGSFSGTLFEDVDADGVRDAGEPPVPGAVVFIDSNNNGVRDVLSEAFRVTDADGAYLFDDIAPGTYNVRRETPAGFVPEPSVPASGVRAVNVVVGQRVRGVDFGNVRAVSVRVTDVFVNGTAWSAGFRQHLVTHGLGEAAYGFDVGAGAVSLDELPWANADQVSLRFNSPANAGPFDLALRRANGATYGIRDYRYDAASRTATWTLTAPLATADRLTLDLNGDAGGVTDPTGRSLLDGESNDRIGNTLPSGDGTVGGDFRFRLNVLPGDVDRDGAVNIFDTLATRNRQGTSTASQGTPPNTYSVFHDVDGNAAINIFDTLAVRNRQGTSLPAAGAATAPSATSNLLFGSGRISADETDELETALV